MKCLMCQKSSGESVDFFTMVEQAWLYSSKQLNSLRSTLSAKKEVEQCLSGLKSCKLLCSPRHLLQTVALDYTLTEQLTMRTWDTFFVWLVHITHPSVHLELSSPHSYFSLSALVQLCQHPFSTAGCQQPLKSSVHPQSASRPKSVVSGAILTTLPDILKIRRLCRVCATEPLFKPKRFQRASKTPGHTMFCGTVPEAKGSWLFMNGQKFITK